MPLSRLHRYPASGGGHYIGYLATPEHWSGSSVLIAHGAPGLQEHERSVADRLAALGYLALAIDYHGEGETFPSPRLLARIQTILDDPSCLREPMTAGLDALRAQPGVDAERVAVIGYCLGGAAMLELAYSGADVPAYVGFHATLPQRAPAAYRAVKGKVLMLHAALDPLVSSEQRQHFETQMGEAGVDWQFVVYGGAPHGFSMPNAGEHTIPGIDYHERTDKRAWRAMLNFLAETIG